MLLVSLSEANLRSFRISRLALVDGGAELEIRRVRASKLDSRGRVSASFFLLHPTTISFVKVHPSGAFNLSECVQTLSPARLRESGHTKSSGITRMAKLMRAFPQLLMILKGAYRSLGLGPSERVKRSHTEALISCELLRHLEGTVDGCEIHCEPL